MPMIRVVMAEDNALLREGISHMIEVEEELDLVGVASDLPELLALVVEHEPDVVVTDIRMPPTGTVVEKDECFTYVRDDAAIQSLPSDALAKIDEDAFSKTTCSKKMTIPEKTTKSLKPRI